MPPELYRSLCEIEERHGISPQEIARRCLEQIVTFYDENGWIGFPLKIAPAEDMLKRILEANPSLQFTAPTEKRVAKKRPKEVLDGVVIFKKT